MCNHLYRLSSYWVNVTPEMTKPVQPAAAPEIGRDEQPDERDNEIVIELDRENQYGRTQPRANEPQGNHLRYTKFAHSDTLHADSILPSVFEVESPVTHNSRDPALRQFSSHNISFIPGDSLLCSHI